MSENTETSAICAACRVVQLTVGLSPARVYEIGECFCCGGPLAPYDLTRLEAFVSRRRELMRQRDA